MLIKIGTITYSTFLPMRNKFVYSYTVKIHALGLSELLESIFLLPAGCGSIFPVKSCQDN